MTAHISVLPQQTMAALLPDGRVVARAIDGTLGAGGHTRRLLEAGASHVLGLDLDLDAIAIARTTLEAYPDRVTIAHSSYEHMADQASRIGWDDGVDAILLDLGVSSMQLDRAERGFAFMQDGPLDMRFNPNGGGQTAAELIDALDAEGLAEIFYKYGEERDSRRLARAVIEHRPYHTTRELAEVIAAAARPARRDKHAPGKRIHPATRAFQALRIAVNDELATVERALPIAIDLLRPGGRLAVISFHSLEDRIVKHTFSDAATEIVSPPGMMLPDEKAATVRLVTRKPITADDAEIAANPRSRSAKLRVVEKL